MDKRELKRQVENDETVKQFLSTEPTLISTPLVEMSDGRLP